MWSSRTTLRSALPNNCRQLPSTWAFALLVLAYTALVSCQDEAAYDLVIKGGLVYDGTGSEPRLADIAIANGKIVTIEEAIEVDRVQTIDAAGKVVSPGFIDIHAHIEPLPLNPEAESFIRQGVTTVVGGPDGSSPLPLGSYLDSIEDLTPGVNVAYLVGHGSVRANTLALESRVPNLAELDAMKADVREAMQAGAFGISTGLKYVPGTYARTDEIIEVSRVVNEFGGVYTSHLRDEGLQLLSGVNEAVEIANGSGCPVVLTHHKVIGKPMWGASQRTTAIVDSAVAAGLEIWMDQYPYTASYTGISVLIPPWSMAGGRVDKFRERCADPVLRDSIKNGIVFNIRYDRGGDDLSRIQISKFDWKPELVGKTLYDWAIMEGMEPSAENGAELVIQAQSNGGASCIYHVMDEDDVVRIMKHPRTVHASDGRLSVINKGHPHPRAFGTFPRVLGHYVREMGVLDLPEAIRKMTSLPAQIMGFNDRGTLTVGQWADITIFDARDINDMATFEDPNQFPVGIDYVLVNGAIALSPEGLNSNRNGTVLRKK